MAYCPSSQGGNAIADILYGDYNPSGKLPFTYPRYSGELMTYDHKWVDEAAEILEPDYRYLYEFDPQCPFGFGLSYTSF
ncbi:MAG: glycoside hydrolase family 3 C-terminal domain-containing protein [Sporocytophaga sp.]|nr:glycoside hydrolase family 3 C-terminal domain-containing protein [Sporocytophaga sp.]